MNWVHLDLAKKIQRNSKLAPSGENITSLTSSILALGQWIVILYENPLTIYWSK